MTAIEALEKLRALPVNGDTESSHYEADDILIAFLKDHDPACKEIAEMYEFARRRCRFWYA